MARAYTSFADGGSRIDGSLLGNQPRTITTIEDVNGKTVADNRVVRRLVLSSDQSALLTQLLEGVVAGGTGTDQDNEDFAIVCLLGDAKRPH